MFILYTLNSAKCNGVVDFVIFIKINEMDFVQTALKQDIFYTNRFFAFFKKFVEQHRLGLFI